ncbi:MAG: TIGR01210 family radical SAM protein [Euryarchaeota archaeon TMED141]|nr:MAG: TIGR01210 family radical SAM protein [Euryarchaeota archaeon TMED141]DAC10429.1 MAG TPA: TIGR01210 family radical SAM protein [Candidatus Poseidoniales archaeon]
MGGRPAGHGRLKPNPSQPEPRNMSTRLTLVGQGEKAQRVHDLVKAPANTPESRRRQASWDASRPATVYTTPEMLPDGTPCSAATVILRTKGCHWWWSSGCTFCGYFNDTRDDVTEDDLHAQWDWSAAKLNGFADVQMVKVYTSGSLLEDREIPVGFQERVLRECSEQGLHLIVESRTEQLTEEKLAWATSVNDDFTVAIGLEAYDDEVLRFHVNKGFTVRSYDRAVANLKQAGLRVKAYLMFKPPFMSEADALDHIVDWIAAIAEGADEISINPMNIQGGTVIDRLHRARQYRPPWLWSLVEMIRRAHPIVHPEGGVNGDADQISRLIVHPTAGGRVRGSHNCGSCDADVVAAIERYAVSGDLLEFEGLSCECETRWAADLDLERALPAPLGLAPSRRAPAAERLRAP